jgi:hypothetical protein
MKTPAEIVIETLGVRPLARSLNISPSTVLKWRDRTGKIPSKYQARIIELANGKISAADMVYGR